MTITLTRRFNGLKRCVAAAVAIVIALAMLISGCSSGNAGAGTAPGGDSSSKTAIEFTLAGIDGKNLSLSDFKGKVVLINFWTTWCPACREEMPLLEAAYQEKQSSGLVVLGVDLKEDGPTVSKFLNDFGLTFPVVLDSQGTVSSEYNVYYIPHTVIVDRAGKVRRVKVGAFSSKEEIVAAVEPFLKEAN